MENIWPIEIAIITFLQSLGDWLVAPMQTITNLGSESFFIMVLPVLMWCVDYSLGMRVGLILMASGELNSMLKTAFRLPRPFWFSDQVVPHFVETGFGFPSGHAMNTITVFGQAAFFLRKKWISWTCGILILLVGISRLFLGMHFISDVLGGWLFGGLLLFVFVRFGDRLVQWLVKLSIWKQVGLIVLSTGLWILIAYIPYWLNSDIPVPAEWVQNAVRLGEANTPHPYSVTGIFTNAGVWMGVGLGAIWLYARGGFDARGDARQFLFRFLIGIAGTMILWVGLDKIFPDGENVLALAFRLVRYSLVGFWVSGWAPAVFIRLKLASPAKRSG